MGNYVPDLLITVLASSFASAVFYYFIAKAILTGKNKKDLKTHNTPQNKNESEPD